MQRLEEERKTGSSSRGAVSPPLFQLEDRSKEYQEKYEKIQRILSQVDVNTMTPLQALQFLAKVKEEV
ncbi:MAG: hypothetical protein LBP53_06730 [Candidatus Peribacteria bacterium]|nr:hypothetical protein [Candidatus Peribacteria bacterium]